MKKFIQCIMLGLLLAVPSAGLAEAADIVKVAVNKGAGDLKVSFEVKDAFTGDIAEAIKSGIPTSFRFVIELHRRRRLWFDRTVGRWEFRHTVKYDTLKEEYEITLDEKEPQAIRTKDFNEMKRLMAFPELVRLHHDERLAPGYNYQLRLMAELRVIKLPFRLDYLLFFLRFWDVKTGWYTYNFSP